LIVGRRIAILAGRAVSTQPTPNEMRCEQGTSAASFVGNMCCDKAEKNTAAPCVAWRLIVVPISVSQRDVPASLFKLAYVKEALLGNVMAVDASALCNSGAV
jgi:hypothetical protein